MVTGTCPICRERDVDSREHVWPDWFLSRMDEHGPPQGVWSADGEPITNRDGKFYADRPKRERVILPVCERCNNELDRRFEKPAKGLVDQVVFSRWDQALTQDEWRTLGLWWAKTILLLGLPSSRYATSRINDKINVRHANPGALDLRWLTDGSPAPEGLSLYVYSTDMTDTGAVHVLPIPRDVVEPDGTQTHFHHLSLATQGACLTVVSHPGWPIEHPLVAEQNAWELLHAPPTDANLTDLPTQALKAIQWTVFGAVLKYGHTLGSGLPPLRATPNSLSPDPDVMEVLAAYHL